MKDIAIYGFGGYGREIASIIKAINSIEPTWNIIGFFDDDQNKCGLKNEYGEVIGNIETVNNYSKPLSIVMAIASPNVLEKIVNNINNPNISFPNIIAPSVFFFDKDTFNLGKGNVICHHCRISTDVTLGNFNLINGCCSFGHDVKMNNFNMLQPETRISGETSIGDKNFFGVRSTVLQGLKIGNETRIGAGSFIIRKTKDGQTYFGNPAKMLKVE
ncbi:MAG: acetyltransferase [Bacteroidales bacterium]|nr:acetyltransferase [Bacteroidales bacterium]